MTNQISEMRYILKSLSRALWESTEMLEILNTPHEIQDHTNKKLKIWNGKIDFENVTFSYIEWANVLEDLNLSIKPGEKVAIVWASGSWKTTLIKLLFRFFDIQWWKILIDWQDISQVTQDSLRSQLSMVPQDPILFHRTIKENIAYWRPTATEQEIIAAAKMAKCHDFISSLKDGYESFVGERWIKLSW
jgi:ATP-binding cassette subfamily B protein